MSHYDKTYKTKELTVFWKPELCQHSGNCFRNLPTVFQPLRRPWVQPEDASTEELIAAIETCPSGALSFKLNDTEKP